MSSAVPLFYRTQGSGTYPLVILHGIFGSSDNWVTVVKGFDERYTSYLIDQRNHGRSAHTDEFNYPAMAADLKAFLDEHNLKDPVLLGHSMGGKVVMNFIGLYPGVAKAIVVVDIAPRAYNIHHQTIIEGLQALDLPTATSRQEVEARLEPYVPEWDTRQFLLKNLYRNEHNQFALRINLPVIARELGMVGAELPEGYMYHGPSLFIRGSKSHYVRPEDLSHLRSHFPKAQVQTIENAGHWVQAEQPAAFTQALNTFLNTLV